jgi:hypothetical protein
MATLTAHDLNQAIGCSCVECDGVVILNSDGKYRFVAFSSSDFCDRLLEVSGKIVSSAAARTDLSPLQTVSLFMDRCYRETVMSESDREKIKILVFSRAPVKELETIFPGGLFQLKL